MRKILYIFIAIFAACSCNQLYKESWELAVDSDLYKVSNTVTKLPITVYCTSPWNAELVSGQDWAELDCTSGSDVTTIHLMFSENDALSRQAVVKITSASGEKTITVIQNPGIKLPQIVFEEESIDYPSGTYNVEASADTNIPEKYFEGVAPSVVYADSGLGWIGDIALGSESEALPEDSEIPGGVRRKVSFRVSANDSGETRSAKIFLSVEDGTGEVYKDSITVSQSGDAVYLRLPEKEIVSIEGGERRLAIETNLGAELKNAELKIEGGDFVSDGRFDESAVYVTVSPNDGTERRHATVSLTYTDAASVITSASTDLEQKMKVQPREVTFANVRETMASGGTWLDGEDYEDYIEGIVIGGVGNPNMDQNINYGVTVDGLSASRDGSNANNMYTTENDRTSYIESLDGSLGFRLKFAEPSLNTLSRGDRVRIFLGGVKVYKEESPLRYTLANFDRINVVSSGNALPVKNRTIATLTPEDVYTHTTLTDMEFFVKDGSFSNIREHNAIVNPYTPSAWWNGTTYNANVSSAQNRRAMDGAANLLYDAAGDGIYMLVNVGCEWRRNGSGVPKGVGPVSGIIVHQEMPRWGGNVGEYSIRPFDRDDIAIAEAESSSWKTLAQWKLTAKHVSVGRYKWVGGAYVPGKNADTQLVQNKMIATSCDPDAGTPVFYSENRTPAGAIGDNQYPISIIHGYRGTDVTSYKSGFAAAADPPFFSASSYTVLAIYGSAHAWFQWSGNAWNGKTNGLVWEFSTKGMSGSAAAMEFSIASGRHANNEAFCSWTNNTSYPVYWKVEVYTSDDGGTTWSTALNCVNAATGKTGFEMRSIPFAISGGVKPYYGQASATCYTGMDFGFGLVPYRFTLPSSVFGHSLVRVRITPASDIIAALNTGGSGWTKPQTATGAKMPSKMSGHTAALYIEDVTFQYK